MCSVIVAFPGHLRYYSVVEPLMVLCLFVVVFLLLLRFVVFFSGFRSLLSPLLYLIKCLFVLHCNVSLASKRIPGGQISPG